MKTNALKALALKALVLAVLAQAGAAYAYISPVGTASIPVPWWMFW